MMGRSKGEPASGINKSKNTSARLVEGQTFRLLRYYSVASLVAFVVVAALLGAFYRQVAVNNLVDLGESKNVALTQVFANSLWPEFAPFVAMASEMSGDELRAYSETARLRQAVLEQIDGLSVLKIKVYDLEGLTVFSTEAAQIGQDKSDNAGYLAARSGQVATELTHRDTFSAFEGEIEDRDVISSYVPIQMNGQRGRIEGVFEVYDDVTPLLESINRTQTNIVLGVTLILASLYSALFFIVRRADSTIKQQHVDLIAAREKAEEANQLKSQFLATISHELRTPLTAIILYADLLQKIAKKERNLTKKQLSYLEYVLLNGERLLALINDVLHMSKIEAGHLKLSKEPFSPTDLLEDLKKQMQGLADSKKLALKTTLDPALSARLVGDREYLEQIAINLISNAIKFTEAGQIDVRFRKMDDSQWAISVTDTGIGIPAHAQEYIFDEFRQVDGGSQRKRGGTGLGLAIVHKLALMMGGKVALLSQPGKGSTFTVRLPIVLPELKVAAKKT